MLSGLVELSMKEQQRFITRGYERLQSHGIHARRPVIPLRWRCAAQQAKIQPKLAGRLRKKSGRTRTAAIEQVHLYCH
jgi:hypothetical protein